MVVKAVTICLIMGKSLSQLSNLLIHKKAEKGCPLRPDVMIKK